MTRLGRAPSAAHDQTLMDLGPLARIMVMLGLSLALLGALLWLASVATPGLRLGRLPGDIHVQRDGFTFYFPITTMVLLSLLVSGILWLVRWLGR